MLPLVSICLVSLLLSPYPSISHPVPVYNHGVTTLGKCKSMYGIRQKIGEDAFHHRLRRSEHEEEAEEDPQEEALSADTVDTMKKINPLTIANQVSQMFRKGSQKNPIAEKLRDSNLQSYENGEDPVEDRSFAVAPKEEEVHPQPWYVKQESPKIVNKPRSNDFGYSVIVMAGDPVKIPIKVKGKGVEIKEAKGEDKNLEGSLRYEAATRGIAEEEVKKQSRCSTIEVRIPKVYYALKPDFPVYDEDLTFVPDPFQGILEENYWLEPGRVDHHGSGVLQKDFTQYTGFEPHSVQVRSSGKGEETAKAFEEKVSCDSLWTKKNSTDPNVR